MIYMQDKTTSEGSAMQLELLREGLDLAFAAGTLATTACIAREDSVRYKEKYSKDEAAKAMGDAKAGLKRALEKLTVLKKKSSKY